ncbi:ESPR-type extended signal peptide-containing protein [Mannheimia granulomatis]|uniref:ESPR-type extended signal peptide-containing protein n=1 Tax=Mannheimia granulomatis TaxID=85402 RepID=UPI001F3F5691
MSWVAVSELQKAKGKTKSVSSASKGVLALVAGAGMVLGASNAFAAISITSAGYASPTVSQYDGIGIGISAVSTGRSTIAIGTDANATHRTNLTDAEANYITNTAGVETGGLLVPSIAIGMNSVASSANAIALGTLTYATGNRATAFGAGAEANGNRSTAVGWRNIANGTRSFAMGSGSTANADFSGAMGDKSVANGTSSLALGASAVTTTAAVSALAIGNNANASNAYATALGANSVANLEKSVALGANSTVSAAVATNTATVGGITYNGFAGNNPAAGDVVSVGSSDRKRQIQNVAAGQISATSTDAINGSQLYMAMKATDNLANSTKNILGGNAVVNPNGSVTYTNIGGYE